MPAASFVAFRAAFGLLMAYGQLRFLARGWVDELYLSPRHHLTYPGFGWVAPLPAAAMYAFVAALAALALMIAIGHRTRLAAALFALGFAYCELIDAALYLNHYWFITLAALLLALLPAPRDGVVPAINVWALRGQLAVVYAFAGLAKLNPDWLFRAEPLDTWLANRTDRPLIGPWLDDAWVAFAFSWAGAAFDLTVVAFLLWWRTRLAAYAVLVVFHLMTAALFQIGLFPWVMIALTPIFFPPDWPHRALDRLRGRAGRTPIVGARAAPRAGAPRLRGSLRIALGVLAAVNIALPLRHYVADGNVRWNDDGYLLAWRVMLTERSTDVRFEIVDVRTGATSWVTSAAVLEPWQRAVADQRADLIVATAHLLAAGSPGDVSVHVHAAVAWNGRLHRPWIDPTIDLSEISRWAPASAYVLDAP